MSKNIKRIDAHIHYALPFSGEELTKIMDATGTDMANLVVVPHRQRLTSVPDALMVKDMYPGKMYVFSSLDVSVFYRYKNKVGRMMSLYAMEMLKCGCDGIKIIEGKPNMRKLIPVPDWNKRVWDPFFDYCEKHAVPILWHVNDPEEFWDEKKAPSWAKEQGWLYDESFVNNEAQYLQVLERLEKNPKIKIIFAHFFFMSAQLSRLAAILDRFPNVMVDITPGIEMYKNFSDAPEQAAAFFEKYQDRIVYGTDIGARGVIGSCPVSYEESLARTEIVQSFLECEGSKEVKSDGFFLASGTDFEMKCLGLGDEMLEKIYHRNFENFVGHEPKKVNAKLLLKFCLKERFVLKVMALIDKELTPDTSCLTQVETYFKNKEEIKA